MPLAAPSNTSITASPIAATDVLRLMRDSAPAACWAVARSPPSKAHGTALQSLGQLGHILDAHLTLVPHLEAVIAKTDAAARGLLYLVTAAEAPLYIASELLLPRGRRGRC